MLAYFLVTDFSYTLLFISLGYALSVITALFLNTIFTRHP
jgi:hypothetical protein